MVYYLQKKHQTANPSWKHETQHTNKQCVSFQAASPASPSAHAPIHSCTRTPHLPLFVLRPRSPNPDQHRSHHHPSPATPPLLRSTNPAPRHHRLRNPASVRMRNTRAICLAQHPPSKSNVRPRRALHLHLPRHVPATAAVSWQHTATAQPWVGLLVV